MSHSYRAVGWNPQKRNYDLIAAGGALGIATLVAAGTWWRLPQVTIETALIRGFGVTAITLLHVVLSIGPLCRIDRRFLPLLYNRRHLGVITFVCAAAHGVFALIQFHGLGNANPLVSVLTTSTGWLTVNRFPFQIAGLAALIILFVMAATSHDFWLRTLTAPVWKAMHMTVYAAYALIVVHVSFGALQSEVPAATGVLLLAGATWLAALHTIAARRESAGDESAIAVAWVDACAVSDIPEKRARIVCASGERIAVFKYDGRVSAISNVCQHQNGPLGEGKIVGGCVVCPWHGYEDRPDTGAAPPPFTEAVPTFRVRVVEGRVLVDPRPLPPGTRVEPAVIPA
jgi:nitrite reductase/ring-hydroxylating ferredoxin subunit/DMSO/TMAO reductase YedYZ heme-binding membrane subunit